MLDYIWFSHGVPVPAVIFGATVGRLDSVSYTCHNDVTAIPIRRQKAVVGLLWPSSFVPTAARAAHLELCRVST